MTRFCILLPAFILLCQPVAAAEPKPGGRAAAIEAATAKGPAPAPVATTVVPAPVAPAPAPASPTAQTEPAALSPSAEPQAVSPAAEADAEAEELAIDSKPAQATVPDLSKASSKTLAKAAGLMPKDEESILFDEDLGEVVPVASSSAWLVSAEALFSELAMRSLADDKVARQALTLSIMKGDERGKDAKRQAYEDKLAQNLIKLADKGDAKSKAELEKLAGNGNRKARLYLGLDKAPTATAPVAAPQAVSAAAAPVPEAAPKAENPAAKTEAAPPALPEADGTKKP